MQFIIVLSFLIEDFRREKNVFIPAGLSTVEELNIEFEGFMIQGKCDCFAFRSEKYFCIICKQNMFTSNHNNQSVNNKQSLLVQLLSHERLEL